MTFALAGIALGVGALVWHPLAKLIGMAGCSSRSAFSSPSDGVYSVDLSTTVGQTGGPALVAFGISGPIVLRRQSGTEPSVFRADFLGSVVRWSATNPGANGGSHEAADVPPALTAALREPFFLEFKQSGDFVGARMTGQVPPFVSTLWQFLGASLQYQGKSPVDEWETEETDSVGQYLAHYRLGDRRTVEKSKRRYLSYVSKTVTYAEPDYLGQFSFGEDMALEHLTTKERIESKAAGALSGFSSTTSLSLERSAAPNAPATREIRSYSEYALLEFGREVAAPPADAFDDQKIGGRTLSNIFDELVSEGGVDKDSKADRERKGRAYTALTAYIRKHPEELKAIVAEILSNRTLAAALTTALRDAGTKEAQQTMRELIGENGLSRQMRGLLVQGLSLVASPTPETVAKLTELQTDPQFKTQATYGLGSNAHRLADSNPALAQSIVDSLVGKLAAASSNGGKVTTLTALGAAGNPSSLAAIAPFAADGDDGVRAAAAQAVRRIPGKEADGILAKLVSDANPDVRLSAIDAISERTPSAALENAVSQMALNDPRVRAKFNAVGVLGKWLDNDPGLRSVLEQVVSQPNQSSDVVRLASRLVAGAAAKK